MLKKSSKTKKINHGHGQMERRHMVNAMLCKPLSDTDGQIPACVISMYLYRPGNP